MRVWAISTTHRQPYSGDKRAREAPRIGHFPPDICLPSASPELEVLTLTPKPNLTLTDLTLTVTLTLFLIITCSFIPPSYMVAENK